MDLPAATVKEARGCACRCPRRTAPARSAPCAARAYNALSLRGVARAGRHLHLPGTVAGLLTISCIAGRGRRSRCPRAPARGHLEKISVSVPQAGPPTPPRAWEGRAAAGELSSLDRVRTSGHAWPCAAARTPTRRSWPRRSIAAAYSIAADDLAELRAQEGRGLRSAHGLPLGFGRLHRSRLPAARSHDKAAWERASSAVDEGSRADGAGRRRLVTA